MTTRQTRRIERILAAARRDGDNFVQAIAYVALDCRGSAIDSANFCRDPDAARARIARMTRERAIECLRGAGR